MFTMSGRCQVLQKTLWIRVFQNSTKLGFMISLFGATQEVNLM